MDDRCGRRCDNSDPLIVTGTGDLAALLRDAQPLAHAW